MYHHRPRQDAELIMLGSIRTTITIGVIAMLGIVFLGPEMRLGIQAGSGEYLYEAKLAPTSALAFVVALAVYLMALRRPDNYVPQDYSAGLMQRFGAFFIDFTLCLILAVVPTTFVAIALEGFATGRFSLEIERDFRAGHDPIVWGLMPISMIILLALLSLPLTKGRRSAGTVVTGYSIRTDAPIGLGSACGRTLLGFITLCGMFLSVPMALMREDKKLWHDLAFNTRAVKVRAPLPDSAD